MYYIYNLITLIPCFKKINQLRKSVIMFRFKQKKYPQKQNIKYCFSLLAMK